MTINFPYQFDRVQSPANLKKMLRTNDSDWIVWLYSGILKNNKASYQPHAYVCFRQLLNHGVSKKCIFRPVLLTNLGQLRIGSVWRYGKCRGIARFEERTYTVNFKHNYWHTSVCEAVNNGWESPLDQRLYPLHHPKDRNYFIQFKSNENDIVSIPSLEFFTRMFGASEEVKRVIATFQRDECVKRLFYPLNQPLERDHWKIVRGPNLKKGDDVFLAHFKHDPWTKWVCKRIHSQIESGYDNLKKEPIFISVDPWFKGPTEITVRGIPFNKGRSFLGLQIMGYHLHGGPNISVYSRKRNGEFQLEPEPIGGRRGKVKVNLIEPPDDIIITGDDEPNQRGSIVEMPNPSMNIRISGRIIQYEKVNSENRSSNRDWYNATESSEFSTGEPTGNGGEVGLLSIHTSNVQESKGKLRDIWNALQSLKKEFPSRISAVEWFTLSDGFHSEDNFKLISLEEFDDDDLDIDADVVRWIYMDARKKDRTRGALIVRITVDAKYVYIVEIQRKIEKKKDKKTGIVYWGEDSMTGLVFTLNTEGNLRLWLRQLLDEIRSVKGIFKKVESGCPGEAHFFNHSSRKDPFVIEKQSALNALGKVDVFF